jgi:amino acid adenylation domain-containing protein/non-ribosomal peptide synthase protein (TIGR01720 family)
MELFFYYMLDKGIYFADTRTCFLSTSHSDEDIKRIVEALKATVREMQEAGFLPSPVVPPPTGSTKGIQSGVPGGGIRSKPRSPHGEETSSGLAFPVDRNWLPTTEGQRQMWIVQQMGNDAGIAYNESIALHLTGRLNLDALRNAIERVVERHEALRLTFSSDGAQAFVRPFVRADAPLVDLSTPDGSNLQTRLQGWLRTESRTRFDLEAGPLFRMALAKVRDDYHVLAVTVHHSVNDARSFELILKELSAFYRGECESSPAILSPPEQFSDFARRQALDMGALSGSDSEAYWITRFQDYNPVLNLPADFARPPVRSFAGIRQLAALPASVGDALKQLGARLGCSFFTVLLAGYSIFLSKLCGQDDIVVGIAAANESPTDNGTLMGYRMNLLPIRSRVSGTASVAAYLASLRGSVADAIEHQGYPFGLLVEKLRIAANASRAGLVSAGFNLDRAGPPLSFHDVQVRVEENYNFTAKFDIFVNVTDAVDGLALECVCNADLVSEQTLQRWLRHFISLVTCLAETPDRPIMDLPMLSHTERHEIVKAWNDTRADYPRGSNAQQLFELQVERSPDSIALSFGDSHLGYQELNCRGNRLARFLMRWGVGPEVLVGIFAEPGFETIISIIAVWKAGGAYLPLDPNQPEERLQFIADNSGSRFLLSSADESAWLRGSGLNVIRLRERREEINRESDENPLSVPKDHRNGAYAIYTSGSTGLPKGVLLEHRGVSNLVAAVIGCFGLDSGSRILQFAPLTFDASVFEIAPALFGGAHLCLGEGETRLVPDGNLTAWLEDHSVTGITMPPSALSALPHLHGALKSVVSAGEACTAEVANKWSHGATLYNAYGPTEATVWASIKKCSTLGSPSIGRPIANTRMYILDGYGEPVAVGVSGELYISGVGLARGYLNGAGLTAEKFIPERFSGEAGGRMYRTGDIGKYGVGGDIEYLGRKDQQVKVRGYRIEMGEIEGALMKHARIEEAVVMMGEGRGGEKRLEAYVVVNGGEELYVNEIRSFLQLKLPEYMVPARYVRLEEMARLASGKVDRRLVKERGGRNLETEVRYEEGRTARERGLVEIWREVLGVERVGVHDNFFELGGDSIMSIQIVSRANERGIRLTAKEVFRHQTIAELARVETGAERVEGAGAEWVREGEEVKLTPIQRWFFEHGFEEPQHWNQSMMYEVRGGLDTRTLETAIGAVTRHHEALRLRFRREEGEWRQYIEEKEERIGVMEVDLSGGLGGLEGLEGLEGLGGEGVYKELLDRAQGSLNIEAGPLMRVIAFRRKAGVYKVLMVVHHLAIDVVSWGILSEDLQAAYESMVGGEPVKLARATTSYAEWSERLERLAQSEEMGIEREYWEKELGRETERLPVDREGENDERSARSVRGLLTEEETDWLMREVPKRYKTRIGEVLLAALGEAIWEWSGKRRVKVDLESHGREALFDDVDLSRTIGWFTSIYPVVLELGEDGGVGARLNRAKDKLRLIRNSGIGYGLLRYITGFRGMDLTQVPSGEVGFNYLGRIDQMVSSSSPLRIAGEATGNPHGPSEKRVHLLEVTAFVWQRQFTVEINYSTNLHYLASVEQLAEEFLSALRDIVNDCRNAPSVDYTPWDFPEAGLDQLELNRLVSEVTEVMKDR